MYAWRLHTMVKTDYELWLFMFVYASKCQVYLHKDVTMYLYHFLTIAGKCVSWDQTAICEDKNIVKHEGFECINSPVLRLNHG